MHKRHERATGGQQESREPAWAGGGDIARLEVGLLIGEGTASGISAGFEGLEARCHGLLPCRSRGNCVEAILHKQHENRINDVQIFAKKVVALHK